MIVTQKSHHLMTVAMRYAPNPPTDFLRECGKHHNLATAFRFHAANYKQYAESCKKISAILASADPNDVTFDMGIDIIFITAPIETCRQIIKSGLAEECVHYTTGNDHEDDGA